MEGSSSNAMVAAVSWLEGVVLGSVATAVAIIAVAAVGLLLLSGRVDFRRAIQVIFGCFILFGASTVASGISGILDGGAVDASANASPPAAVRYEPPRAPPTAPPPPYDPYAGAAVPPRP